MSSCMPVKASGSSSENERMGQTDEKFSLPRPTPPAGSTARHSSLNLARLVHWRDGVMNTRGNNNLFIEATKDFSWDKWVELAETKATEHVSISVWRFHGIVHTTPPVKVANLLPTSGGWFYTDLAASPRDPRVLFFKDPQVAYHGCSLDSAARILKGAGLRTGVSTTGGKPGIYCERARRVSSCMTYATHTLAGNVVASCVFQLCVDRSVGTSVNKQWVQPEGSVLITGLYTHVVPLTCLFAKGYFGWYCLHSSIFTLLPLMMEN